MHDHEDNNIQESILNKNEDSEEVILWSRLALE